MKKYLACAIILAMFGIAACKKEEQKPATQQPSQTKSSEFKPKEKKKKGEMQAAQTLKIFQETQLVTTIPQAEYATITTTKIKVGQKELNAVLLKDLLAKNNIQNGKTVTLAGQTVSAQITWEQANSKDVYVIMTPKKALKIQANNKALQGVKLPKRLDSITVSATEMAATDTGKQPANK